MITDLSSHGAQVRLKSRTKLCETVVLVVHGDNLRLEASIRWKNGASCGLEFSRQIAHPHLTRHRMRRETKPQDLAQIA